MLFDIIVSLLEKKISKAKTKKRHDRFCREALLTVPRKWRKHIVKKYVYDLLRLIDGVACVEIADYHRSLVLLHGSSKHDIPIQALMAELHLLCLAIYNFSGVHKDTLTHLARVQKVTKSFCEILITDGVYGEFLEPETIEIFKIAAILHDVGKLLKNEKVLYNRIFKDKEKEEFLHKHVDLSLMVLEYVKMVVPHLGVMLDEVMHYISEHHEMGDGSGYPNGKVLDEITLGGRVVGLADKVEASQAKSRRYKSPITYSTLIKQFREGGVKYDQHLVSLFDPYLESIMQEISKLDMDVHEDTISVIELHEGIFNK